MIEVVAPTVESPMSQPVPVTVHIEGMGVLGSMIAWQLYQQGMHFTWSDTEDRYVAWEASSGLIYPTGDKRDIADYLVWERWINGNAPWSHEPRMRGVTEMGAFWFASQSPPNGAKYRVVDNLGTIRRGELPSFHLNVPRFVLMTREVFRAGRLPADMGLAPTIPRIIAHGTGSPQFHHYVWGWTAHAVLDIHPTITAAVNSTMRPCFYLRTSRYKFSYANPLPGDPTRWVVGSSHIPLNTAKDVALGDKVRKWQEHFEGTLAGLVQVRELSDPITGWRPSVATEREPIVLHGSKGAIFVPPMAGNGVRLAPSISRQVLALLGVAEEAR